MDCPPPRIIRPYTLFPDTTLFRSAVEQMHMLAGKAQRHRRVQVDMVIGEDARGDARGVIAFDGDQAFRPHILIGEELAPKGVGGAGRGDGKMLGANAKRSEEHTSELQSLMRISYAVFCLKTN